MDYGKLAYLRLDELESMINTSDSLPIKNTSMSIKPNYALRENNNYNVTTLSGSGSVGLFITAEFNTNVAGSVGFYIDEVKVGSMDLSVGISQYNVNTSIRFDTNAELTVIPDSKYQGMLNKIDIVLVGQDAYILRPSSFFCAGQNSTHTIVMYHDSENAKIDYLNSSNELVSSVATLNSTIFDLAVNENGNAVVCYVDNVGNTWYAEYSISGQVKQVRIADSVDNIAVYCGSESTVVAFLKNKKISYVEILNDSLTVSNESELDIKVDADDISFVRDAVTPTLFITSKDKIFVLFSNAGFNSSSDLNYTLSAGVEEI